MFFLKDLPSDETLCKLEERYENMSKTALECCILLMRAGSDLMAIFEKILAQFGLSQGGFLTLIVLNRKPYKKITPSVLADKVGVTRATMTGLLDTLTKDGLIERLQHKEDGRKTVIALTIKGRKHLDSILPGYYHDISLLLSELTETEQKTLILCLNRVIEIL